MSDVLYISEEGLAGLKAEYEEMKTKTIPLIAARIDEAKQNGDLSENAEYQEAKEQMAFAQGRFRELEEMIRRSQIITHQKNNSASRSVQVGSRVTVETDEKQKREYQIVGSAEAEPLAGKISNESPLGAAFLGHEIGDIVEVRKPSGVSRYTILEIV